MKFQLLPLSLVLALAPIQVHAAPADSEPAAAKQAVPEGSYILAEKKPEIVAGQTMEETFSMTMEGGKFTMDAPQGKFDGSIDMTTTRKSRATAVSPEKINVLTEKDETARKMTMNGNAMPSAPEVKPLVGVPLVATLSGDKWTAAREDGAEATAEEAAVLKKLAKTISGATDRAMYGTEPRKPGDHWKVDAKETLFAGDEDMKDTGGTVELTFDKVGDYQGSKCAYLSGNIEVTGTMDQKEKETEGKLKMTGKVSIIRSLDRQVDLLAEMKGAMEMEMKMPAGTMNMNGPMNMKSDVKILK